MRTLIVAIVMLCPAWPVGAQTVTLRASVESQSLDHVVLRLNSGELVRVPRGDVVKTPLGAQQPAGTSGTGNTTPPFPLYDVSKQCVSEWPSDDLMQTTCKREQQETFTVLTSRRMVGHERQAIRDHCSNQYRTSYRLRNFCEEEELRALESKSRRPETSQPKN